MMSVSVNANLKPRMFWLAAVIRADSSDLELAASRESAGVSCDAILPTCLTCKLRSATTVAQILYMVQTSDSVCSDRKKYASADSNLDSFCVKSKGSPAGEVIVRVELRAFTFLKKLQHGLLVSMFIVPSMIFSEVCSNG